MQNCFIQKFSNLELKCVIKDNYIYECVGDVINLILSERIYSRKISFLYNFWFDV